MENRADQVIRLLSLARQNRELSLSPKDADTVMRAYGINTVKSIFVQANLEEVVAASEEIGFPLVCHFCPMFLSKLRSPHPVFHTLAQHELHEALDALGRLDHRLTIRISQGLVCFLLQDV